jgi:hypothetical protein
VRLAKEQFWINRPTDQRSRPFRLFLSFGLAAVVVLIALPLNYLFGLGFSLIGDNGNIGVSIPALYVFLTASVFFGLPFFETIKFRIFPYVIDPGFRGMVKFRGAVTGEVADDGPILLPLGYDYDLIDCRPQVVSSGFMDVSTSDGFQIKANLTAWIRIADPLLHFRTRSESKLIEPLMNSTLFAAASERQALNVIGNRAGMSEYIISQLRPAMADWGYNVDRASLDVENIPPSLTKLVQMLSILQSKHSNTPVSELVDFIMLDAGTINVTKTQNTNVHRVEIPGLDQILAAAAKRFSPS